MEATICFSIEIDKNISKLSDYFGAMIAPRERELLDTLFRMQHERNQTDFCLQLGLKPHPQKKILPFKVPADDNRLFSNYFTNIIVQDGDERVMKPMRYRVRPRDSREEVPAKYNVFNARIDSLESRQTWIPLFMRNHGVVPFVRFFEWVRGPDGRPKLIAFKAEDREIMWAPCLWDEWVSKDGSIAFKSFAIITDGPPPEIERMGHDRCPIFLLQDQIENWLSPEGHSKKAMYEVLTKKEKVHFQHDWVS